MIKVSVSIIIFFLGNDLELIIIWCGGYGYWKFFGSNLELFGIVVMLSFIEFYWKI